MTRIMSRIIIITIITITIIIIIINNINTSRKSDVWLTVHRNSVWIRKTN